ncbi:hypothetical protein ACFYNO_17630 [Kitasatospora sp. NPDC006697]|uniref:hypothetical protein n=1 Tax=Kitasatospora sp. NPDC006697 TaxID=3364020 RepID=UPI0036AD97F2
MPLESALSDPAEPFGPETAKLLAPPAEPRLDDVPQTKGTTALFVIGGILGVLAVMSVLPNPNSSATQVLSNLGRFVLPAILLGVARSKRKEQRRAAMTAPGPAKQAEVDRWRLRMRVWQAAWVCRRCRVTFFPADSIRPDFPASPAIKVAEFPLWVMTATDRAFGPPVTAA